MKNQETGKGRVLLRREQVLKLACNCMIDPKIELQPLNETTQNCWKWIAMDNSDGEPEGMS